MIRPCDMTPTQLESALIRLSNERKTASPQRRAVIVTVADAVLDELLVRSVTVAR